MIRQALVSLSDKSRLDELARGLSGARVISTGGTARALRDLGVEVVEVAEWTGFPECFGGRVKTLHPRVHGGILFHRERDAEEARRLGIEPIDLVAVNLYPFERAWESGAPYEDLVEEIDIGGVTLLRAAAKAAGQVLVLCHPEDYAPVLAEAARGEVSSTTRRRLQARAFAHTARYDALIAAALGSGEDGPEDLALPLRRLQGLRYGENPHQAAAAYALPRAGAGLAGYRQVHGKDLSYTNLLDLAAARSLALAATACAPVLAGAPGPPPVACAVVKHAGPCGLATAPTAREAVHQAWEADPVSAFGSVVFLSSPVDEEAADLLGDGRFVEVVAAPAFTPGALDRLGSRPALRLLEVPPGRAASPFDLQVHGEDGLVLVQTPDEGSDEDLDCVTEEPFPVELHPLARFAAAAARSVKSNAIALAREHAPGCFVTAGLGGGQPNRVDSVRLALERALRAHPQTVPGQARPAAARPRGAGMDRWVLASDAFFPFPDSVEVAAAAGVRYLVQPGGSLRDAKVIEACNRLGVAMAFTGRRHFRH